MEKGAVKKVEKRGMRIGQGETKHAKKTKTAERTEQNSKAPEQYKGIGIRIEDNLLVTEDGHENLTISVPKTISDIEAVMQANKG